MLAWLNFVTDSLIFSLIWPGLLAGIALLLIADFVPDILAQYKLPAALGGVLLVIFFTYESGRHTEVEVAKQKENVMQIEFLKWKEHGYVINEEVVTKYIEKIKVVTRIKEVPIVQYVTKEADAKCVIDPVTANGIRLLFDDSIKGIVPTTTSSTDGKTSGTSTATKD